MKVGILLLMISLFSVGQSYCATKFKPLYSDCTFYYDYWDENCTNYQFQRCSWQYCVEEVIIDNRTTCSKYDTKIDYSWPSCTHECCLSSKYYPNKYESLVQCADDLRDASQLGIVGTIFIVLFIFFCICGSICCAKEARNNTGITSSTSSNRSNGCQQCCNQISSQICKQCCNCLCQCCVQIICPKKNPSFSINPA